MLAKPAILLDKILILPSTLLHPSYGKSAGTGKDSRLKQSSGLVRTLSIFKKIKL
jgi:hypothetical protein